MNYELKAIWRTGFVIVTFGTALWFLSDGWERVIIPAIMGGVLYCLWRASKVLAAARRARKGKP